MSFMDLAGGTGDGTSTRAEFTIALGVVANNMDASGTGRVQVRLPWLAGVEPWARVAVPGAGSGRGTYVLPHEGDEVLLAFNRSDLSDCYVVGSLWSMADPPPLRGPLDPTTKIAVTTEAGHDFRFDDLTQTVTLTTATGQKIELGPEGITIGTSGGTASIELAQSGTVTIQATTSLTLKAPRVTIEGSTQVSVESSGAVSVNGGQSCRVQATTIMLN